MISHAFSPQVFPLAWAAARAALPAMSTAVAQAERYHGRHLRLDDATGPSLGSSHLLYKSNLQQPTASFAAKAAIDRNSDEDPMASTTISHNTDHQQQQQQQQQQPGAGSGAAANAAGWLPHDVRMVMRKHAYSYPAAYLEAISPKHLPPNKLHQKLALRTVQAMRSGFDLATGYKHGKVMDEGHWLRRIIFLETVAGVPGMVGGMLRHLRSLRLMRRDNGWINTLLEEAENERMHLLTFMEMRQPGVLFRGMVIAGQAVFFSAFAASYMISPKFCHAFVGYLEEEAVKTYTQALQEIDAGCLWPNTAAPPIACYYWGLPEGADMRQLVLAVRADEAHHSHVNHTLARMPQDGPNPFVSKDSHLVP